MSILAPAFLLSFLAPVQDWPQFRGPGGLSVAANDATLPARFGPDENLLWRAELPAGHSSPCIVGDRIFLTGFADEENVMLAVDRASGKELWRRTFPSNGEPAVFHPHAVPSCSSPTSDGEVVVAYFGRYGLVAFDLEGELQWKRELPHPGYGFGVGTSPLLFDGIVVLMRDGAPETALLVLDAADGSELWKIDRFGFNESHGSPFLWENSERTELVIGGTNKLCSYDPGSGELLWTYEGICGFPCTTPTADGDTLYYAAWSTGNASGRSFWEAAFSRSLDLTDEEVEDPGKLFARLDADGDGHLVPDEVPPCRAKDAFGFLDADGNGTWEPSELTDVSRNGGAPGKNQAVAIAAGASGDASEAVLWTWERGIPYVASPLFHRGRVWLLKSGGVVTALDAETGEPVLDRERLSDRSEYYLSPVGVGDRVLVGSAEGTLYVLDADAKELAIEHEVSFDEPLFATPAVLGGQVYVRTETSLWAFGAAAE